MYVVGTHLNGLCEASLMSGHNFFIFFNKKNFRKLTQNYYHRITIKNSSLTTLLK